MTRSAKEDVCIPDEGGAFCVPDVVVRGYDLPSQHVVSCQEIDVTSAGLIDGEGHCVKMKC